MRVHSNVHVDKLRSFYFADCSKHLCTFIDKGIQKILFHSSSVCFQENGNMKVGGNRLARNSKSIKSYPGTLVYTMQGNCHKAHESGSFH